MNLREIRNEAWQAMGNRISHPAREPGYIYYHGQRVAKIALQLRGIIFPQQDSNDDLITVGSWFHDVGKGIEPHWEYGALLAKKILETHCSHEQLEIIVEIIVGHTLRKEKEYPYYVKLVQDADILDHYGSQEIWLNFLTSAYKRASIAEALEFYDQNYGPICEKVQLLLNYPQSLDFFLEKDRFVRDFMERFRLEGAGELIQIRKD